MPVDPLDTMPPDEPEKQSAPPFALRALKAKSDRDSGGRFRKGHGIKSPGNPNFQNGAVAREMQSRIDAAAASVMSEPVIAQILQALVAAALKGDVPAAKLVLSYVGLPRDRDAEERLERMEKALQERRA